MRQKKHEDARYGQGSDHFLQICMQLKLFNDSLTSDSIAQTFYVSISDSVTIRKLFGFLSFDQYTRKFLLGMKILLLS